MILFISIFSTFYSAKYIINIKYLSLIYLYSSFSIVNDQTTNINQLRIYNLLRASEQKCISFHAHNKLCVFIWEGNNLNG